MGGDDQMSAEMQANVDRLARPKEEIPIDSHDPFPVCPSKELSKVEMDKLVQRLHDNEIGKPPCCTQGVEGQEVSKKIDSHTLDNSIDRQYTAEMERRKQKMEELRNSHLFKSNAEKNKKVVSNAEFVQRMYDDRIAMKKATEERLYNKYIVPTEITVKKKSKTEIENASNRLSTKD